MLVDDNPADLFLAREAFAEFNGGIHLTTCSSALGALDHLRDSNTTRPDVIITDLNMPGLSGLDLIGLLKADPALRLIPVVILSTSSAEEDILEAYSLHASSYMVKAKTFPEFLAQIDAFVAYWRGVQHAKQRHR
ncbi:response regulator [Deinococcus hohokamensis]|uniref:Response regulator n=1 Tax=Deinococcus hohokamensis TaxID=309883 RepID=A0ABV9I581_9DEIO